MATAHVHHLHELSERNRIDVAERDNRLAEARAEAALLRRMLEGEFTGWRDSGGGEVRLYESVHYCGCTAKFVVEDDDSVEAPAWMTAAWLRAIEPKLEIKVTEGVVTTETEICAGCAWREGLL